ncbi:MAG: threonine/serine exporter family protein [Peptostreptococcaceae bacterium]
MDLLTNFLYSFMATLCFSIHWHVPKNSLIPSGVNGAISWTIYKILISYTSNIILSNFIAAFVVSFISEILARKLKQPAIVFVIPGIIPLVPGLSMYNTTLNLIQQDYDLAISTGANVIFIGGSIALGVLIVTSIGKTINNYKSMKNKF